MTPERALLARMVERLDEARRFMGRIDPKGRYAQGHRDEADDLYRWLTAEMATLERERST